MRSHKLSSAGAAPTLAEADGAEAEAIAFVAEAEAIAFEDDAGPRSSSVGVGLIHGCVGAEEQLWICVGILPSGGT